MARMQTVLAYGVNDLLMDYHTCAGYTLNTGHKGEWPLAFYLLEVNQWNGKWNVLKYLPITINPDNFAIILETR